MNLKTRNWLIVGVVLVAVFFLARYYVTADSGGRSGGDDSVNTNNMSKVVVLEYAEVVEASGALEAQPFASLTWKTGGIVDSINVNSGDTVKAGEILLSLQPESTSASIASAQAELVNAQKELDDLLTTSGSKFAQATINLDIAEEEYETDRKYLYFLQTDDQIPQDSTEVKLEKTRDGWAYVYYRTNELGPASPESISDAENDLALKTALLEEAQLEYDRLKDGPNAQDVLVAQARIDAAQATVNSLYITAPFDGQVLWVQNVAGDLVDMNSVSVHMADMENLFVDAQVDESDVTKIREGNQVQITLETGESVQLAGEVVSVNPVGEDVGGLVKYSVRIALDEVGDDSFLPLGATADVVIQVQDAFAVLGVPIEFIQNDEKGEYLWVAQGEENSERVDISSGDIVGDYVIVDGDLSEGDILQSVARESSVSAPGPFGR